MYSVYATCQTQNLDFLTAALVRFAKEDGVDVAKAPGVFWFFHADGLLHGQFTLYDATIQYLGSPLVVNGLGQFFPLNGLWH